MDYAVEKPVENPVDNTLKKSDAGMTASAPEARPLHAGEKTGTLTEKPAL